MNTLYLIVLFSLTVGSLVNSLSGQGSRKENTTLGVLSQDSISDGLNRKLQTTYFLFYY